MAGMGNLSSLQNMSSGGAVGGTAVAPAPAEAVMRVPGGGAAPASGEIKKSFDQVWNEIQSKYGGKEEKQREVKKSLGKDDFLKIMLTQLKHQDPSKPMEADKMATEMAQLTSVEQLQNVNKAIEGLVNKSSAQDKLTMAGLIGKSVTIERNRFPHTEDSRETMAFTLPEAAQSVKATIISETGETVYEKDLGPQNAGENSFNWDGKKLNTIPTKTGNYTLRIDARGANQKQIMPSTQIKTQVVAVNFEGSEPVLLVGNPERPEKVSLKSIIKIDAGALGQMPMGSSTASAAGSKPAGGGSYFSFVPGQGSKPLDANALPPAARAAIEKLGKVDTGGDSPTKASSGAAVESAGKPSGQPPGLQQAMAQAMSQAMSQLDAKEKGFPSGLNSDEQGGGARK